MHLTTSEIAAACAGAVVGPEVTVDGVTQDSRSVREGQLFVALVDARDGHDFIPDALAAGAPAYLTSRPPVGAATAVVVADTARALADLGRAARARIDGPVVAITGSVGKTTTKDLAAAVLSTDRRTGASEKSFNNEIGVPLTLANLDDGVEAAVIEMGARAPGDISHLCSIAAPTVGIVTTVAEAHVGEFGSVAAVAKAKGELPAAIGAGGWAVLNADNGWVAEMASLTDATVVTFGDSGEVRAESVSVDDELRPSFRLVSPWGSVAVGLAVRGEHNVANALAAAAAGLAIGVTPDQVAAGLAAASLSPWRMDLVRGSGGAAVLNDAYNANPTSVKAALRALARVPAERRVAVLGVMAELGEGAAAMHRDVGDVARSLGIRVIGVGTDAYSSESVPDVDAAVDALGSLDARDAVLVKGSRVAGLETLVARLVGG